MRFERHVAGLDVGSTKITIAVAKVVDDTLEMVSITTVPSAGIRKGVVIDMDSASESIMECYKKAKEESGFNIKEIYVSISGGHISSIKSSGAVGIADGVVKQKDIDKVLDTAQTVYVSLDKEVLHIIPEEFVVDGETEIMNPIGMRGVRLEANVQIVTGSINAVQNLLKCCEMAGLDVVEIVLDPLVSSMVVLKEDEREYGVLLVDIGGGNTKIGYFKNNTFLGTSIVDVGGNQITNDLAVGLRLSVVEAERLKKAYGMRTLTDGDSDEEIELTGTNREEKTISATLVTEIIKPRCEEILVLIKKEIQKLTATDSVPCGLVLTGGISLLIGVDRMVEQFLNVPVRCGGPNRAEITDKMKGPAYSTAVGLLYYAKKEQDGDSAIEKLPGDLAAIRSWFKKMLDKLFKMK